MWQISPFNSKDKIARLSAIALFFAYVENFFPHFLPFLRFGFANVAVLFAFDLCFENFLLFLLMKSIATSMINGMFFSPFFLISITQTFCSGIAMFFLNRISKRFISIYGISIFGAVLSAFVQIFLCGIYLGSGVNAFLGIMILFSVFSGILTAFISEKTKDKFSNYQFNFEQEKKQDDFFEMKIELLKIALILCFIIFVFVNQNLYLSIILLCLALLFQIIVKRKILIVHFAVLFVFTLISSLISPSGKVLFSFWKFSITQNSLNIGLLKAIKLCSIVSISQVATTIRFSKNSFIGKTLFYYGIICKDFELVK